MVGTYGERKSQLGGSRRSGRRFPGHHSSSQRCSSMLTQKVPRNLGSSQGCQRLGHSSNKGTNIRAQTYKALNAYIFRRGAVSQLQGFVKAVPGNSALVFYTWELILSVVHLCEVPCLQNEPHSKWVRQKASPQCTLSSFLAKHRSAH